MTPTTDLDTVRRNPNAFTWGTIRKIHDVGPRYTVVEYYWPVDDAACTRYLVYVDGNSTNRSPAGFDQALLVAIAQGRNDPDSAYYAGLVLKVHP